VRKTLIPVTIALLMAAAPAFAANEYFVVQHPSSKTCSVSKTKPDGKASIKVGKTSYKTAAEANAAMKAAPECKKK